MGSVVLAYDEVRGREVALKRMITLGPAALVRFKREFRVVERATHPNLVQLYELEEDASGLFFTMELVIGVDFRAACEKDADAFRRVVPQVLEAVAFLHAKGIVHRDLKPSNVLVRADGVAKVLDFGLATEFKGGGNAERDRRIAGTIGYMAPEVLAGEGARPASDVYSLAVMLSEVAPADDEQLRALCMRARLPDPVARAALDELLELVSSGSFRLRTPVALHGRESLFTALAAASRTHRLTVLSGPTGAGKSTLVRHLAGESTDRLVLRGAARLSERVAFNALDRAIDDLAVWARSPGPANGIDPAVLARAATAFPALAVHDAREDTKRRVRAALFGEAPPPEPPPRDAVFGAIGQLLTAACERTGGVLMVVDDFQWADEDSLALLTHLLEDPHARLSVVLALRDDAEESDASRWARAQPDAAAIALPPLAGEAMIQIARSVADGAVGFTDAALGELVAWCHGRPFLAELVGRTLVAGGERSTSGDALLRASFHASLPVERRILAVLIAVDGWLALPALADIVREPLGDLDDAVARLEQRGLVRRGGASGLFGSVDLYHDGVRAVVAGAADVSEVTRAHSELADRLMIEGAAVERVVRHLTASSRTQDAAVFARQAARSAERRGAFGLAADLYRVALQFPAGDESELLVGRARALERSGRYADAATCWSVLAGRASGDDRTELLLSEAHALLASARPAEGLATLTRALDAANRERIRPGLLTSAKAIARFATGPFHRARAGATTDAQLLARADRDVKIGILLSFLDPLNGVAFLQRAQRRFDEAGAFEQAAMCDYTFASHALIASRRQNVQLSTWYRRAAERRLRGRSVSRGELDALPRFLDGVVALRRGEWAVARDLLARAAAIFAESGAASERMMALSWSMMADVYAQDVVAMKRHLAWFRNHLAECGEALIIPHVELLASYIHFLAGDFAASLESLERRLRLFPGTERVTQRDATLLYRHMVDIYGRDASAARRAYARDFREVRGRRFFSTMYGGAFAMIAALLEANALRVGDSAASFRRVEHFARIIEEAPPLAAGASLRARAYARDALGQRERAIDDLAAAERLAARYGRRVDRAIAAWQRGRRLGGETGRALCADAERTVEELGASTILLSEDAGLRDR